MGGCIYAVTCSHDKRECDKCANYNPPPDHFRPLNKSNPIEGNK